MAEDQAQPWKIPPIVQELVAGVQEPPSRYVVREQDRPAAAAAAAMPEPIPIVDLSRLSAADGDGGAGEFAKLRSALQNWGLFLAVGHGIEPGFLGEMMQVTRGFFNLPLEEKQKYSNLVNGREFRFERYGNDIVLSEDQILDWCDRLYLIVEPESRVVSGLWPAQPPAFRDALVPCHRRRRARRPHQGAGPARGPLRHRHDGRGRRHDSRQVQLLPALPQAGTGPRRRPETPLRRIGDHRRPRRRRRQRAPGKPNDGGAGVWYDVPIIPNALLVNVGDAIEIMSNGFFVSPVHRAVTNAERDRVSLAMFYTLDPEKEMEPLPEMVNEKRSRRYRKTTTKDYLAVLFERFARGRRALDTVKISVAERDSGARSEDG